MATGTNTFMGKAVPIDGESQITAITAANDILTLTGATSHTGDFFVCENSTGAELFVIDVSGNMTTAGAFQISSSATTGAVMIEVTSTGAIAEGAITSHAVHVDASSKSVLNAIIGYNTGGGTEVGSCDAFFAVHGSKAPTYLFSVGATAIGVGAAADNGFVDAGLTMTADPTSDSVYAGIKCLLGSKVYYVLAVPDSSMT